MALHNNDLDLDHEWLCAVCFKAISQYGPPTLNLDNCSCSETGAPINDPDNTGLANGLDVSTDGLPIDTHGAAPYPASDDGSIKTPDGPDARDPGNQYLPLAPAAGLGEVQHRRRASYDEVENQMSYPLRHYLKSLRIHERPLQGSLENGPNGWLRQDSYLVGPTESVNATWGYDSRSGSATLSSERSAGSSGLRSWNVDPMVEMGAWAEGDFAAWPREIDDAAFQDDDNEGNM